MGAQKCGLNGIELLVIDVSMSGTDTRDYSSTKVLSLESEKNETKVTHTLFTHSGPLMSFRFMSLHLFIQSFIQRSK